VTDARLPGNRRIRIALLLIGWLVAVSISLLLIFATNGHSPAVAIGIAGLLILTGTGIGQLRSLRAKGRKL
jgi:hypothetical protein